MNWKQEGKLVNCTNYFNEIGKQRLAEALEAGEKVRVYIDCIGHTRAFYESRAYEEWLKEHYGDKILEEKNAFGETTYCLK